MAFLACKVTPRSGCDSVTGLLVSGDGSKEVAVRVTAPPDKGKANKAVCRLIARELDLPKSAVSVHRGDTSHHKLLEVALDDAVLDEWVGALPQV